MLPSGYTLRTSQKRGMQGARKEVYNVYQHEWLYSVLAYFLVEECWMRRITSRIEGSEM